MKTLKKILTWHCEKVAVSNVFIWCLRLLKKVCKKYHDVTAAFAGFNSWQTPYFFMYKFVKYFWVCHFWIMQTDLTFVYIRIWYLKYPSLFRWPLKVLLSWNLDGIWIGGSLINPASNHVKDLMTDSIRKSKNASRQPFLVLTTTVGQYLLPGFLSENIKNYMDWKP